MNRPCWWISLALIAFGLAVSVWLYPTLPEQVATHWNIRGEADGYGPKWMAAWALPVVALGLLGVMALLPWLSPKAYPIDASAASPRAPGRDVLATNEPQSTMPVELAAP